jgi:manganese efflux pump family protein
LPFSLIFDNVAIGMAVGVIGLDMLISIVTVGITAFITSIAGMKLGKVVSSHFKTKAPLFSGIILLSVAISFIFVI